MVSGRETGVMADKRRRSEATFGEILDRERYESY